jgi:hypothetical protein
MDLVGLGLPVVQPVEIAQAALGEEPLRWKLWQSPVRWELVSRLTPGERVRFAAARRQGWLLQRRGGRQVGNCWWMWCRACGIPCVRVYEGQRWSRIRVDLDLGERDLVDVGRAVQVLRGASQGHIWVSKTLLMADRVPVDVAEETAAAVARLLGCTAAV